MVPFDRLRDLLEQHGLAGLGRGDDQRALPETDGRDEVEHAHGRVALPLRVLKRQAAVGVDGRQLVKRPAQARGFGLVPVDGLDVHERAVAVAHAAGTRLSDNQITGAQGKAPDLRDGDVDILRSGRAVLRAQEAVAAGLHLQHALPAAEQAGLQHFGHDGVARAVFLVVIAERLGLVQPDVRFVDGRLFALHSLCGQAACKQLDDLRLVDPAGQAHLLLLRQLAQLHDRHAVE